MKIKKNKMQNETVVVQNKTVAKSCQLQFFEVLFLLFQHSVLATNLVAHTKKEKAKTEPEKKAVERSSKPFYFAQRPFHFAFC